MAPVNTGVIAAVVSSALGGTAAALTRYTIHASDPVTLAAFRFGIGSIPIVAIALALGVKWPKGRDWLWVTLLGALFFSVFFVIYNVAMSYTTAARGSLALSMLPLTTMLVAALMGREALGRRKSLGVLIAVGGVALALSAGLRNAPPEAWRGDLVMAAATLCMALYNVWSRPLMQRSSMMGFLATGMGAGALLSVAIAWYSSGFEKALGNFGAPQWWAVAFLGLFGGAAAFYLWVFALERTTPTRVANTMTVNPVAASLVAAVIIGEPVGIELAVGIAAVGAGIWIAAKT
ncbi:MAG TPA: DMT family transporter [Burkholderiales bacterium]|nr:DMT family transporter [Burkholderiales bacterium]